MSLHKPVNRPKRIADPRSHILRVATDLFLERGYGGTSIDDVIAVAGGSKATLSKYFGNKAGLFQAAVMEAAEGALTDLPEAETHADIRTALTDYGVRVLSFYLEPASLMIYRSLISGAGGDPTPARALYENGHGFLVAQLAEMFRVFCTRGEIVCNEAEVQAQQFLHLIRAGLYEETLLGLRDEAEEEEIAAVVHAAVETMLTGLAPR